MDSRIFAASPSGRVVRTRTGYDAFVPDPLPPVLDWKGPVVLAVEQASRLLGALSGALTGDASRYVPLLSARDAVGGVRSEGRAIRVSELFDEAATGVPDNSAVRLARNYVAAVEHARERVADLPVSLRLVRELHFILLDSVADPRSTPGRFRKSQNWLGEPGCTLSDAQFVPPPVPEMHGLLDNWERFLHEGDGLPALVRLSLALCQYLIIQPFLDMNALAGAVVCPVLLQHLGAAPVQLPVFGRVLGREANSLQQRVIDVCATGCWEEWLTWHLYAIAAAARETLDCVTRLQALHEQQVRHTESTDSESGVRRLLDLFYHMPTMTREQAANGSGLGPDADDALDRLASCAVLQHAVGPQGDVFVATDIIGALENGGPLSVGYLSSF